MVHGRPAILNCVHDCVRRSGAKSNVRPDAERIVGRRERQPLGNERGDCENLFIVESCRTKRIDFILRRVIWVSGNLSSQRTQCNARSFSFKPSPPPRITPAAVSGSDTTASFEPQVRDQ